MTHMKMTIVGLAAAALLCACTSSPGGPQNTYTFREGAPLELIEGNRQLAASLKIKNVQSKHLDDGRLLSQFELVSVDARRLHIDWAVEWFDASGMALPMPGAWQPLEIGGMGMETIQITAPKPEASSWRLAVRPRTSNR